MKRRKRLKTNWIKDIMIFALATIVLGIFILLMSGILIGLLAGMV